jgi:hypothetical protein
VPAEVAPTIHLVLRREGFLSSLAVSKLRLAVNFDWKEWSSWETKIILTTVLLGWIMRECLKSIMQANKQETAFPLMFHFLEGVSLVRSVDLVNSYNSIALSIPISATNIRTLPFPSLRWIAIVAFFLPAWIDRLSHNWEWVYCRLTTAEGDSQETFTTGTLTFIGIRRDQKRFPTVQIRSSSFIPPLSFVCTYYR